MPGNAVSTATNGDRKILFACERDGCNHVVDVEGPDDQLRPAVDHAVERDAPRVVANVARLDHRATMALPQIQTRANCHSGEYERSANSGGVLQSAPWRTDSRARRETRRSSARSTSASP